MIQSPAGPEGPACARGGQMPDTGHLMRDDIRMPRADRRSAPARNRISACTRAASRAVYVLLVTGCASTRVSPTNPLLTQVIIEPIRIEAQTMEGANGEGREWALELLRESAASAAARAAVDLRLAREVRFRGSQTANGRAYRLDSRARIPVALPPALKGSRAFFRDGDLVAIGLTLSDPDGNPIAHSGSALGWHDVPWTTGSRGFRRPRAPEAALIDAISKGVQEAVRALVQELTATGDSP